MRSINTYHALKIQSVVRKHLRSIIGLANSNQGAENLLFMARHALSVCKQLDNFDVSHSS